ncbi:sigma-54 dependent transcriptional regulator [Falsiroseomonas selenitidurans]|uniref:Sigma-54-dependent Fis family transcriptional regulator n=1 Tax=Falsiroseomonas selenitidurans TaxID=2716335 RepID=A0ABX1EGJ4_9PROT|nr:sigma-54 dependent transcriptional regulator [Falsiroseomonas selenitidurans]NKC34000.1 sigma-54-dependent Fis family transcriptional regulator [Falsiroseomonas selenitidurans]
MSRLLILGPLAGPLGLAARMAQGRGAAIAQADTVPAALAHLRGPGADLALCHVGHDVAALLRGLAAERIACPVVACGPEEASAEAVEAVRAGARDFLPLPPDADLIAAMLEAAAGVTEREAAPVARDPAMLAVLARAAQVARAEASVLITGESGTGKEVLARHLHAASRRAARPFVALNCAALPETLLESELFGHEKGAFSGAVATRKGKFEQADGGTLLLDEIGEMDPRLQAKILRVIQEREVDRLGGGAPVRVDVRILAATNRDLLAEVRAGRFREDLYFRLDVVRLRLPPLRERPADILPLAEHFARRYADANGLPRRALSPAARASLAAHPWPGNVRELENAVHRAVLLAEGAEIGPEAIELTPAPAAPGQVALATGVEALVGRTVDDVERDLIIGTLSHCLGNRTRAAEILGISIRALRNKIQDYRASGLAVPAAHGYAD